MNYMDAIDSYINGNISDFTRWLKRASKLQMLDAIEYFCGNYGKRHEIINQMRIYLERS